MRNLTHLLQLFLTLHLVFLFAILFSVPLKAQPANTAADLEKGYYSLASDPYWKVTEGLQNPARLNEELLEGRPVCEGKQWLAEVTGRSNPGKTVGVEGPPLITYCRVFELDSVPDKPVAVRLSEIDDKDRAFVNGVPVGSTGDFSSAQAQAYDKTRIYSFNSSVLRPGKNIIVVHVKGYSTHESWGMITERTGIGKAADVYTNYYIENFSQLFFLVVYATVGIYFLFLYFNRRKDIENLIFALFSYNLVIYQFLRTQIKYELSDSFLFLKKTEYIVLAFLVPLLYMFVRTYFKINNKAAKLIFNSAGGLAGAIVFVFIATVAFSSEPETWSAVNKNLNLLAAWPLFIVQVIAIIAWRSVKLDRDALILATGLLVLVATAFIDALSTYGVLNLPRLAGYGFFVFIINLALILANRFVRLHKEVEDLNINLERKVEERTEELNRSLTEVRNLKERQDGDYYLTSLLIKPLASAGMNNPDVSIESYTEQKKKFEFRNREGEIGGDISIADEIELQGRKFTAFMNADAMGKSVQGAGGALVVGTVFKALLSRTRSVPDSKLRPPERWLKEAYREIQDVFCTFDGSMLISASIGLIDRKTGTLYYLNAEHPWGVLYRNGKAEFLEKELMFYKFGVDAIEMPFYLRVIQLEPNDALFFGSDGRDDIIINEKGSSFMNEDSDLFLKHIEHAGGDLSRIAQSIKRAGEITDDLSLLKVAYMEDAPLPDHERRKKAETVIAKVKASKNGNQNAAIIQQLKEAIREYPEGSAAHRELGMTLARQKDFPGALKEFQKAFENDPSDLESLYMLSFLNRRLGTKKSDIETAADYGERVRMRDPSHVRNLLNLAECYRILSNPRAEKIAKEVIEKDPGSADKANRILSGLGSDGSS